MWIGALVASVVLAATAGATATSFILNGQDRATGECLRVVHASEDLADAELRWQMAEADSAAETQASRAESAAFIRLNSALRDC